MPFLTAFVAAVVRVTGSDEALLRRVAGRDHAALRDLYDRCSGIALAVALRVLRVRAEAEDVVQESFLEVWKRADTFDSRRGTAAAWIIAIARSRALDRIRARSTADRTVQTLAREDGDPVALPIEAAVHRQNRERIQGALAALPAEQRTVLQLAYFEGLSQREIAERCGDPLGTVKTRVRLALEKLSGMLGDAR